MSQELDVIFMDAGRSFRVPLSKVRGLRWPKETDRKGEMEVEFEESDGRTKRHRFECNPAEAFAALEMALDARDARKKKAAARTLIVFPNGEILPLERFIGIEVNGPGATKVGFFGDDGRREAMVIPGPFADAAIAVASAMIERDGPPTKRRDASETPGRIGRFVKFEDKFIRVDAVATVGPYGEGRCTVRMNNGDGMCVETSAQAAVERLAAAEAQAG